MPLTPGTTLGPYEILSPLGAGGMGEVYKATDSRLDRTVAIKVLPEHVAADPELKQRFEREAKTISSLNHPHICTLYDIGRQEGIDFLVMEYLDGETLAERLKKGALPLDQGFRIAVEIADALDKAHRQGVVHRDLKPGNIMLTKSGAKLLDFGLAKLRKPGTIGAEGLSAATTESEPLTSSGTLLGTLPYMAPEQLEGKGADGRTDIFAFGALLYEMATGQRAFTGDNQASLIAAILAAEPPPISRLQPVSPPALDRLVKKALAKDPGDRWQDARDVTGELQWMAETSSGGGVAASSPTARQPATWQRVMPLTAALLIGGLIAGFTVMSLTRPGPRMATRFTVPLPTNMQLRLGGQFSFAPLALSPDGRMLVYVAGGEDGVTRLYRRPLDQLEATLIPGTENAEDPFFSPTGERVGFFARIDQGGSSPPVDFGVDSTLKTVSLAGGSPVTLWEGALRQGASWGPDDTIVLGHQVRHGDERASLWQISAAGGEPTPITTVNFSEGEEAHFGPEFLPGGRAVLFQVEFGRTPSDYLNTTQIAVLSLDTGERRLLLQGTQPHYIPDGHIVYVRGNALWRVPFDSERLEVTGQPVPVPEPVQHNSFGFALFTFGGGTLAYRPRIAEETTGARTLVWVDREGREEPLSLPPRNYEWPRVSLDGTRVAVAISDPENTDVWVSEWLRGTLSRVTTDPGVDCCPLWTPGGDRLVFASIREGHTGLFWKAADGRGDVERLLTVDAQILSPYGWSPDGKELLVNYRPADETTSAIWVLSMEGERSWEPLLQSEAGEFGPELSPDGSWLAYTSDETGRFEVYVERFPALGDRRQISTDGGSHPTWSSDGRELFYLRVSPDGPPNAMMVVPVYTEPAFTPGTPAVLFERAYYTAGGRRYDVAPDGRFLMIKQGGTGDDTPALPEIVVVQHWLDELARRVPSP